MIINAGSFVLVPSESVAANFRCPGCSHLGTFETLLANSHDFSIANGLRVGERRCPNSLCRALVIVVWQNNKILRTYPPVRIDFDKINIPDPVVLPTNLDSQGLVF